MTVKHLGGYVELTRTIDSIRVGPRHRTDLGDLTGLIESIRQHGLLQPITVTPDGQLVCGARRLAAIRALDYRTVSVWVRAVSGAYSRLNAEHEENRLHEPLTAAEVTTLRDHPQPSAASRGRKQAPSASVDNRHHAESALGRVEPPTPGRPVTSRPILPSTSHGPTDVGGGPAGAREESTADLPTAPEDRGLDALMELARLHERAEAPDTSPDERRRLLDKALQLRRRIPDATASPSLAPVRPAAASDRQRPIARAGGRPEVERFAAIWDGLDQWWADFDPSTIAAGLEDEQWARVQAVTSWTAEFVRQVDKLRAARRQAPRK